MTDCSQLPSELAHVRQQRAAFPANPIAYCRDLYMPDDPQGYKACLRGLNAEIEPLDAQISALSADIAFCNALIGTWTIHSANPTANGQQFTITNRNNTDGRLEMTFTFNDGTAGQVDSASYGPPSLYFVIGFVYAYNANLDTSTSSPQLINGVIGGLADPSTSSGLAEWTATKS